MCFNQRNLIYSDICLAVTNKDLLQVLGNSPIVAPTVALVNTSEMNFRMSFRVVENFDEADDFILRRYFNRRFDAVICRNNAMFHIRNTKRKYVYHP